MLAYWLTCAIEAPWWLVCWLWIARPRLADRFAPDVRAMAVLFAIVTALGINLTQPVVWLVTADRELTTWLVAEAMAWTVEALIAGWLLHRNGAARPWLDASLFAVGANATSALVGVLFF